MRIKGVTKFNYERYSCVAVEGSSMTPDSSEGPPSQTKREGGLQENTGAPGGPYAFIDEQIRWTPGSQPEQTEQLEQELERLHEEIRRKIDVKH